MALLDEVRTRLIGQSVGVAGSTAAWSVFLGWLPDAPDKAIGIFETGGLPNESAQALIDRPTFQVRVRSSEHQYSTGRTKLAAARTALEIGNTSLSGRYYVGMWAQGEALSLGVDENRRPSIVLNFLALRSQT